MQNTTRVTEMDHLKAQLASRQREHEDVRATRELDKARSREQEIMWKKQQTEHEMLAKRHCLLQYEHQQLEEKLKTFTTDHNDMAASLYAWMGSVHQSLGARTHGEALFG